MRQIKITALSAEGFNSIQEKLDTLPSQIKDQIERAESFITVNCFFKGIYGNNSKVYLPKETLREIVHKEDWIIAYCKDFTFHITHDSVKTFSFI